MTLGALKTFRCHRMEVTYEALLRKPHGLFRPWYCSTCSTHQLQSRDEVHLEAKLTCHSSKLYYHDDIRGKTLSVTLTLNFEK